MINSKALKSNFFGKSDKSREAKGIKKALYKAFESVRNTLYYPVHDFLRRFKERSLRAYAYAKLAWLHYDFDSAYLYDIMAFKLKRILKTLEKGPSIQEKEDMDALKEAIKICNRLFLGRYEKKYHRAHDKKWGDLPRWKSIPDKFDEKGKPTMFRIETGKRPNIKTKAHEKQERKGFMECYELAEQDRCKDIDRLAEILKKHATSWWD